MKRLFYSLAALLLSFTASAQLQNLNFENWDNPIDQEAIFSNSPTGWICSTRWFGTEEANFNDNFNMPIETDSQNGDYAIKLFTWYNYLKDAAVQTAPINNRPSKFKGFYKYEDNLIVYGTDHIIDTAQVVVVLTKWNEVQAKKDTIGLGVFKTHIATSVYQEFVVDIEYFSNEIPDSITVLLDPSIIGRDPLQDFMTLADGGTSTFTLDNLSLEGEDIAGINDIQVQSELTIYPNPVSSQINLENMSGDGFIYDMTGKQVSQFTVNNRGWLDVSHLAPGLFIIKLQDEKDSYTGRFVKF